MYFLYSPALLFSINQKQEQSYKRDLYQISYLPDIKRIMIMNDIFKCVNYDVSFTKDMNILKRTKLLYVLQI